MVEKHVEESMQDDVDLIPIVRRIKKDVLNCILNLKKEGNHMDENGNKVKFPEDVVTKVSDAISENVDAVFKNGGDDKDQGVEKDGIPKDVINEVKEYGMLHNKDWFMEGLEDIEDEEEMKQRCW